MTDKLYIIGNGFDRHHGLRTLYEHFRDDYAKEKPIWTLLSIIYGDQINKPEFWWQFEEMLSHIDYNSLTDPAHENALAPSIVKNFLTGQLPPLFGYWIQQMGGAVKQDIALGINKEALFLTFNYTLTLEKAYQVEEANVWHIHRSIKDKDSLIIGHDTSTKELSKQMFKAIDLHPEMNRVIADDILKQVANGAKKVKDKIYEHDLNNRFDQYCDIKHFIAMGFSFNDIDMPYIEKLIDVNRNIADADWTLYVHSPKDYDAIKKLIALGIDEGKIATKNW